MVVSVPDHNDPKVAAVRAELALIFRLLGEYREHLVLVGGWVPSLLTPQASERHTGSLDIDIALDHKAISDDCYERIRGILEKAGYSPSPGSRFRFVKKVVVEGQEFLVHLDLLAAEYGGRGKKHEHQHVQDLEARKARGCDLAFKSPVHLQLEMALPDGAMAPVRLRIAGVAAFLAMKAFALAGRDKPKDAYDIVYCLKNFAGGMEAIAQDFEKLGDHGLVTEALKHLESHFRTPSHVGPTRVADYLEIRLPEERVLAQRDAHERVVELLTRLRRTG